jgi:hypothetical protein
MTSDGPLATAVIMRRHLRFGWIGLLAFLTLGILLEAMHGFKVGWYLDEGQETRRLLFTLAHAHGVLLALVNVLFAATLSLAPAAEARAVRIASPCLVGAGILLPTGFLLGGLVTYGGDPGLGIFLIPPAALMLFAGVAAFAWALHRAR